MRYSGFLTLLFFLFLSAASQQQAGVEFGKVSVADLSVKNYRADSSAGAVVVADIGSSDIVGNDQGWFSLHYNRYTRIHVLTKEGYSTANWSVILYTDKDSKEVIKNLSGITYNLENGVVVKSELDTKKSVFTEKVDKNHLRVSFAMPAVKEGSIIECRYTIISDFIFNLQPWTFQGEFPHLWSEYNVSIPQFFNYVSLTRGSKQYHITSEKQAIRNYAVSQEKETMYGSLLSTERITISASVSHIRWVMKDVPALKTEPYTSALENHLSGISFQLSEMRSPLVQRSVLSTWPQAVKDLLAHEKFGAQLLGDNSSLRSVALKVAGKNDSEEVKARKLFALIRNHMTCTDRDQIFLSQSSLYSAYKKGNGNVADINIMLVAILREAGLSADPVILSLRSNGYAHGEYPLIDKYNYVICRVMIDGTPVYLDASYPKAGFGWLHADCYNGQARVILDEGESIDFSADSLKEVSASAVFLINDKDGDISGKMINVLGSNESYEIRALLAKEEGGTYINNLKGKIDTEIQIQDSRIDSLQAYEHPLQITLNFRFARFTEDLVYLNPMFGQGYDLNPFKSTKRLYPVEIPYTIYKTHSVEMDVPEGYKIESLPKPQTIKLNEKGDGIFEYEVNESAGHISIKSRLKISRTFYAHSEYPMLREFFALVVKKQSEQIVFKKKL